MSAKLLAEWGKGSKLESHEGEGEAAVPVPLCAGHSYTSYCVHWIGWIHIIPPSLLSFQVSHAPKTCLDVRRSGT